MREHNSDNFNLSLFQCMCHFNKLFVKRSLGAGNSNSDTYLITHVWQSLKSDDETYGAVKLNNQIEWYC